MTRSPIARWLLLCSLTVIGSACGNKPADSPINDATAIDVDADPLALLPSGGFAYVRVDLTRVRQDKALSDEVDAIAPGWGPFAAAEFVPSRDLNSAVCTAYSATGLDGVCVLTGAFKADQIETAVATYQWPQAANQVLVKTVYQGKTLFTLANMGFTLLSPKTAIVGNESAIRRTLDRIADRKVVRTIESWALETLETKDADAALVVNADTDVAKTARERLPAPLQNFRALRAIANVRGDRVNVASTISFADAAQAEKAEQAIAGGARLYALGTLFGKFPSLNDFEVKTVGSDTQVKGTFLTGDVSQSLHKLPRGAK